VYGDPGCSVSHIHICIVSDTALRGRNVRFHLLQAIMGDGKTFHFVHFSFDFLLMCVCGIT